MPTRITIHPDDDPGLSLALAMVVASTAPLLLLDGELRVVAASASFCRAFGIAPAEVAGWPLLSLGDGEWNVPQLRSLLQATAAGDAEIEAYEMDLKRPGRPVRRLVVNVQKLAYGHPDVMRLLMAVADVTEARERARHDADEARDNELKNEELLRENEMLLQEVRHRVANSLQIIASVLMQNARRTQSEETRSHLRDAHNRVMSVADLQQQLAASTLGAVRLRDYLTKLCETIAASMIRDPETLTLTVVAEDVVVHAGISVSLGLIVTELVINALKHGFPDGTRGEIVVDYQTDGPAWTLSVGDTGIGMAPGKMTTGTGLGTSIVQALARQLQARVEIEATHPGMKVSVIHPAEKAAQRRTPELAAV